MPIRVLNSGDSQSPSSVVLESGQREIVEIRSTDAVLRIEDPQREIVETTRDDVPLLLVVEPVLITPDGLGITFGALSDVDVTDAVADTPLVLVLHNGSYTVEPFTADGAGLLTAADLGVPNRVASLGPDGRLAAAQRPPERLLAYTHVQPNPSTVWVISHGLEFEPAAIEVIDHNGTQHYPQVVHLSPLLVQLRFGRDVRGTARLS